MNLREAARPISVLLFFMSSLGVVSAQTATGTITGTVNDISGATVARAKVTVTSPQIGLTRETASSDSGEYSFALLPVGVYSITTEQCLASTTFTV